MSTLEEIRTAFIKRSGRIDLVGSSGGSPDYSTDNGADWFINQGQRLLDNILPEPVNEKTVTTTLTAGSYSASFAGLRVPFEVWATNSDNERWSLIRQEQRALRVFYNQLFSEVTPATPAYWAVGHVAKADTPSTSGAVTILPPPESDTAIEVLGTFYSDSLDVNSDTSWWSVNHPGLLVLAALHELEVSMRNTAGANDWMVQIDRSIRMIDHDLAQSDSVDVVEFEG